MTPLLTPFLARLSLAVGAAVPPSSRRTRRSAPRTLAFGCLAFVLLTLSLATLAETSKPEWRDPEYGHRLKQVRNWQTKRPHRPLVLFVGSSRTQYGVSPHEMGFPDEPGSPLVYNFGYRGAVPLGVWLQFTRVLDSGIKPRAVVVHLAGTEMRSHGPIEEQRPQWGPRLSSADIRRLAPFTNDASVYQRDLTSARRNPWEARRVALLSAYLPEWQLDLTRAPHRSWEVMDRYGYCPIFVPGVTEEFKRIARADMPIHREIINHSPIDSTTEEAYRRIVDRCRANNIAVAMCWAAESPSYRAMYNPAGLAARAEFERRLTERGVPVFPGPEHLDDDDFADGYHLMPDGTVKYSKWLADKHLKPWLAEVIK